VNSNDAELYTLHINNGQAGDVYVPVMMTPVPRVDYLAVQAVPPNSGVKDMPPEISHGTFTYPTKLVGLCSWSYGAADVAHNCDLDVTDTAGNSINVGPRTAGSAAITVDVPPGIHYAEWTMHVAKTFPANTEVRFKCRYNNGGGTAYLRCGITSWVYPDKG
jgi:hypothetical protein